MTEETNITEETNVTEEKNDTDDQEGFRVVTRKRKMSNSRLNSNEANKIEKK